MSGKLTKRAVTDAQGKPTRYEIWDAELPGFGVRIEVSGTKTFILRYRAEGGGRNAPRRFMAVGRFGVLTLDQARKKARKLLALVACGNDPAGLQSSRRKEMMVGELCDLYMREGVAKKSPLTVRYDRGRIDCHIKPLLGKNALAI